MYAIRYTGKALHPSRGHHNPSRNGAHPPPGPRWWGQFQDGVSVGYSNLLQVRRWLASWRRGAPLYIAPCCNAGYDKSGLLFLTVRAMSGECLKSKLLEILAFSNEDLAAGQAIDQLEKALRRPVSSEELGQAQLELIQSGQVVRGRQGVQATLRRKVKRASPPDASRQREADTYGYVEDFLRKCFVPDVIDPVPQMVDYVVEVIAAAGGSAGLWTKPDLALATVTRYRFAPQPELELYGFEVKKEEGCTVYAVHEALAHAAFVHYTAVIAILADGSPYRRNLARMREQASGHGVGLVVIPGVQQHTERYEVVLEPRRHAPALWRIDEFIETRFSDDAKAKLLSWLGK